MKLDEFNILLEIHLNKKIDRTAISKNTGYPIERVDKIIDVLTNSGMLDKSITPYAYQELNKYKVDNAIIMAAGFGLRSLPLSRVVPKGLYNVCGEVLIERQIKQLKKAGIEEIIVVVGYLKEKFRYLEEKYGVIIIENDEYYRYNNISSLYAARQYLKNSYVCCSDNYFNINVFKDYVYDSYYSCKYTENYADEYCVTEVKGDYITEIKKGGSNAWYTIGEAYFSREFSKKFLDYLNKEYGNIEVKKMLWDDFHIKHIENLPIRLVKYTDEIVQEFDTIEDIKRFDPNFEKYEKNLLEEIARKEYNLPKPFKKYDDIERYNSATTNQHTGRLHLNENTFGPSPKCLDVFKNVKLQDLYEYDMATDDFLIREISKKFSMPEDDIYIHCGSAETIKSIFSITLEKGDNVLLSEPGWSYYESLAIENFCSIVKYTINKDDYTYRIDVKDLLDKAKKYAPKLIVITSPHNPTGCKIPSEALEKIVKDNPDSLVLLDEAYFGFSEEDIDIRRLIENYSNLIVSRTFSKYYGLADLRIGFAFCNFKIRHILGLDLPLFRVSSISRKVAVKAMEDRNYYEDMCRELNTAKLIFSDELNAIEGIRVFESYSNFVPVLFENIDLIKLKEYLRSNGILIRLFNDGNEVLARIAVAEVKVMKKTAQLIKEFVSEN